MPNPNKTYTINFNLVLDDHTDAMLIRLAADLEVSKAHVCRSAIQNWHTMAYRRTPLCADQQKCRCPHAHIYAPVTLPPAQPPGGSPHD